MRFAPVEVLAEKLHLTEGVLACVAWSPTTTPNTRANAGCVNPFAIRNAPNDVSLWLEQAMLDESLPLMYHPMTNNATLLIDGRSDLLRFLQHAGVTPNRF